MTATRIIAVKLKDWTLETHVLTEEEFEAFVDENAKDDERIKIIDHSGTLTEAFEEIANQRRGEHWKVETVQINLK